MTVVALIIHLAHAIGVLPSDFTGNTLAVCILPPFTVSYINAARNQLTDAQ